MIITVTLNAAIDKSLSVPNFRLGRRHRTVEQRTMAGGKGVNIARALKALGQPVIATGMAGGVAALATLTCAEVIFDPSQQTAIAEVADPARRGRMFGVVGFAQTVGIALAPLIGGILLDLFGEHGSAGHVTMWSLIACFALFVRRRRVITTPAIRVA